MNYVRIRIHALLALPIQSERRTRSHTYICTYASDIINYLHLVGPTDCIGRIEIEPA